MKLRKPCKHGRYERHGLPDEEMALEPWKSHASCPGGVFLPDDALEAAAKALQDWDEDNGYDWWASDSSTAEEYRRYYRNGVQIVLDALISESS